MGKISIAYYLANNDERERLLHIVNLVGRFLVKAVDTLEKRNRYSKSLLGVRSLYEMGFNDRVIATRLADIVESDYKIGNKKDIKKIVKQNTEIQQGILSYLEHYPSYFYDRAEKMITSWVWIYFS